MECCIPYTGKFWWGETFANLANCELFAKIFLTNIHRYTEDVFGIAHLPNFSSPIVYIITCMVCQNFSVYGIMIKYLLLY